MRSFLFSTVFKHYSVLWRRGTVGFALLLICCFAAAGAASADRAKYYTEVLPNGMRLILCERSGSPTCSLNVFCKVGGFEENENTMGISHFFEHLFFRGTSTLSGSQFKRAIEALGGETNASTGRDFTHYFINLPSRHALQGMHLLADALKNAELSQEAIDQERRAVLEEYRINLESPPRILSGIISEMAYPDHPYGRPIIGSESTIRSFNSADFRRFRDTFISPERTCAVVVGDFRRSEMLAAMREEFGNFERSKRRIVSSFDNVKAPDKEVDGSQSVKTPASFVMLGFMGPSVKDKPDIYRADLMSFMLGMGRGSMISEQLTKKGRIQDGGVQFMTQRFPSLIGVFAIGRVGTEDQIKADLLEVVKKLRKGSFTDRDLRRAKAFLRSNYSFAEETNAGLAENLGFYASIDDVSFVDDYLEQIEKITRADIMAAADKYLSGGFYCVVLKGQPPRRKAGSGGEDGEAADGGTAGKGSTASDEAGPDRRGTGVLPDGKIPGGTGNNGRRRVSLF